MRGLALSATVVFMMATATPSHAKDKGLLDQLLGQHHKDKRWHDQRYGDWRQPQYDRRWRQPMYGYGGPSPARPEPDLPAGRD